MQTNPARDADALRPGRARRHMQSVRAAETTAEGIGRQPRRVADAPASRPTDSLFLPAMTITIQIPTIMRSLTRDQKYVEAHGQTVIEAIAHLERNYPGLQRRLMQGDQLHRFVNIYVNDDDIRFNGGLSARLRDGDTITILPAVAGG
ncbi:MULTISPECIES: MoaD family protein [Burkholderia]|uniref:MoaD family protein n=1 Tax=Burkholderia TaxID=32008 RepID=UPI0022B15220|nr:MULTISPECIES: MoaD family protein [Burkholderia]